MADTPTGRGPSRWTGLAARVAVWWLDGLAYHGAATVGVPCQEVIPPSAGLLRARARTARTVRDAESLLRAAVRPAVGVPAPRPLH